jgi:acyl-CoA reductase-like NAD-dependent aldehyde dehydrogenase
MSVTEVIRPKAKAQLRHVRMLIDGAWIDSLSGMTLTVENPAKRRLIATIPRGDAADVEGAVEAAAVTDRPARGAPEPPRGSHRIKTSVES